MRWLPISFSDRASKPTQERMVSSHRKTDGQPYSQNPYSVAGSSAIWTRNIVRLTELPPWAWGEATGWAVMEMGVMG